MQEAEIARHEQRTDRDRAEGSRNRTAARDRDIAEAEKRRLICRSRRPRPKRMPRYTQGEAEAEIIFKKGEAEAKAMNIKAEAYQEYNQAAVVDKLITGMPEVVRALASPLANVDKITIVSTGDGHGAGMSKITGDMARSPRRCRLCLRRFPA